MAKGQKRSNRELKKPKAAKAPVSATSSLLPKGISAGGAPKKKG